MTEHTGLPVKGYSPQPDKKVAAVNTNKEFEERLLRLMEHLAFELDADSRWIAIAKTHFEQGFMALNRAVFRPTRVALPEDTVKQP